MNLKYEQTGSRAIVYDADCIDQPDAAWFDPDYWCRAGRVVGHAVGRGNALLLDTPCGAAVLRRYYRGGWAARFSSDRYLFVGFRRSRPCKEAWMLGRLKALGLPVPAPLAALCERAGPSYRGALLTRRIEAASPLADVVAGRMLTETIMRSVGRTIRQFHDAGVVHADLNARNILIDRDGRVHLIDFDRGHLRRVGPREVRANLERLKRSLVKSWPGDANTELEESWKQLRSGYDDGGAVEAGTGQDHE